MSNYELIDKVLLVRIIQLEPKAQRLGMKIRVHMTEELRDYYIKLLPVNFVEYPITVRGHEVIIDSKVGIELWEEIK